MVEKPEFHKKGWGAEYWVANSDKYCGKLLHFEKGKRCSYHFHKLKSETFFLNKGQMQINYGYDDDIDRMRSVILNKGESFDVPVGMRHQMIALEESDLFEFSTEHFEEDSYRLIKGD